MAEEVHLGRLVAEIALEYKGLEDDAEQAEAAIQKIDETAKRTKPEVGLDNKDVLKKARESEEAIVQVGEAAEKTKPEVDLKNDELILKAKEAENAIADIGEAADRTTPTVGLDNDELIAKAKEAVRAVERIGEAAEVKPEIVLSGTDEIGNKLNALLQIIKYNRNQLEQLKIAYHEAVQSSGEDSDNVRKLDERIKTVSRNLEIYEQILKVTEYQEEKNTQAEEDAAKATEKLSESTDKMTDALKDSKKSTDDQTESAKKLGDGYTVLKGVISNLVTDALKKAAEGFKEVMTSGEKALNTIQARTGATNEEMAALKDYMYDIYKGGYGESLAEIADTIAEVKANTEISSPTQISEMAREALTLSDTFGMDVNESIRAVNALMNEMGLTADEAFDYIAKGAQSGLDKSHELTDNLAEYTQLWAQAGFSAGEMFSMLQNGIEGGAYSLDRINEMVGQFASALSDGKLEKNLDSLSSGTAGLFEEWKKGKATQADVLKSVINDLAQMDNQQQALSLSAQLLGTQSEDTSLAVIAALNNVNHTFDDVAGTMESINQIKYDDVENKISDLGRQFEVEILKPIVEGATPGIKNLISWVSAHLPLVISIVTGLTTATLGYKAAVSISSIVMSTVEAIKKLAAAEQEATAAQNALNAAQKANLIGLVAGAIGLLVGSFSSYSFAAKNATSQTEKFNESLEHTQDYADSSIAKIQAETEAARILNYEYDTLRTKEKLTADEKERLNTLAQKLAGILGTTVEGLKDEQGAFRELNTEIEENNKKLIENAKLQAYQDMLAEAMKTQEQLKRQLEEGVGGSQADDIQRAYEAASRAVDEYTEKLSNWGKETTETEEQLARINKRISELEPLENSDRTGATSSELEELRKISADLTAQLDDEAEKTTETGAAFKSLTQSQRNQIQTMQDDAKAMLENAQAAETLEDKLTEANRRVEENQLAITSKRKEVQRLYSEMSEYSRGLLEGDADKSEEELWKKFQVYQNALNELAQLKTAQEGYRQQVKELTAANKTLADSLSELEKKASNSKSAMSDLASTYSKVNSGQKLDLATLISLSEKYPEYAEALLQARDSAEEQAKVISKLFEVKKQEYIITLQAARDKIQASDDETVTITGNAKKQIEAYASVMRVMVALGLVSKDVASAGLGTIIEKYTEAEKAKKEAEKLKKIAEYNALIDAVKNGADISDFTGGGSSGSSSSGGGSSDSDQYRTHGSGVEAFGRTQAESYLKWIDRMKQLGKMSIQSEIDNYEAIVKKFQLTSDEKYDIELRLYQARQKLREEEISALDKLGDAVVSALKNRYQQQKELEEKRIDESIKSWKKWEDETCNAIQGQIDALDELKSAHDEENKREEYENKRQALELKAQYEKDDYNRKQFQKEIAALDKEESERLF